MRLTLTQIMQQIGSTVNQEATAPTAGGAEYNLWLNYINRGIQEWSEANDWEALRKYYRPGVTGISQASVALPLDYKKLAAPVKLHKSGEVEGGTSYADILEEQQGLYKSTDEYVYETGDSSSGFNLVFHPGTLSSGASVEIQYYAMPTSLASPAEVPMVSDSQFLVDRTIAFIFEARSDVRYQTMESKARDRLLTMVENSNLSKYSVNSLGIIISAFILYSGCRYQGKK